DGRRLKARDRLRVSPLLKVDLAEVDEGSHIPGVQLQHALEVPARLLFASAAGALDEAQHVRRTRVAEKQSGSLRRFPLRRIEIRRVEQSDREIEASNGERRVEPERIAEGLCSLGIVELLEH